MTKHNIFTDSHNMPQSNQEEFGMEATESLERNMTFASEHCSSKASSPLASIIVPVYNSEHYLRECLDSIVGQTLRDMEIICVDDGSTDESLALLQEYAARDGRIQVLQQQNQGGGAARNTGLDAARGDYLAFWDSDDFFEPDALETALSRCQETDADVAIFGARGFNDKTKTFNEIAWLLKSEYLPEVNPFSRRDVPLYIFNISVAAPWNKLYRREFILEKNLRFQPLQRANDVLFVYLALAEAERIVFIDRVLCSFRAKTVPKKYHYTLPIDFYYAYLELKKELIRRGLFAELEQSFVNAALLMCYRDLQANFHLPQIRSCITRRSLRRMYNTVRKRCFPDFGILNRPADYFYRQDTYEEYRKIERLPWSIYLADFILRSTWNKARTWNRRRCRGG